MLNMIHPRSQRAVLIMNDPGEFRRIATSNQVRRDMRKALPRKRPVMSEKFMANRIPKGKSR